MQRFASMPPRVLKNALNTWQPLEGSYIAGLLDPAGQVMRPGLQFCFRGLRRELQQGATHRSSLGIPRPRRCPIPLFR